MSFAPSSPVTGSAQTGLTSPTYTLSADVYPAGVNGKQFAVSALGGTQTGVYAHSIDRPFTIAMTRPKAVRSGPSVGSFATGKVSTIPKNEFSIIVRKGVASNTTYAPYEVGLIKMTIAVPAGAGTADAVNVRAALSLLFGVCFASSDAIGDVVTSAVL